MNYDIASELSGLYDLSRTIPASTIFSISASGIFLLCAAVGLILFTKRKVGLRLFPVMYGFTAYLLFYLLIGNFLTSVASLMVRENSSAGVFAAMHLTALILSTASLVGGRFFSMWFIRKYYSDYCDAYGIGVGVSLTEAAITGITILFNYSLCMTINNTGLAELANSYETVEEASQQLAAIWIFFDNPAYTYLLSGIECIIFLIFNTMISVLFYGVYHGEMKKIHILTITGLQALMYFPGNFYSAGLLFNRVSCFIAETAIFAGCVLYFLRIHNTFYRDVTPPVPDKKKNNGNIGTGASKNGSKMPDFNKNINKL